MPITAEGVRLDSNPVPLWARESWTLPDAALVFNLDYETVRQAAALRDLDTFRPKNRDGNPGRRHVSRKAMDRWIESMEE